MNRSSVLRLLMVLFLSAGTSCQAVPQELPNCGSQRVQYSAFDARYSSRITVEVMSRSQIPREAREKQYSPYRTMWQVSVGPDYMKNGPWSTTIYLGSDAEDSALKLGFVDHGNGGAEVRWLNENLVFGRVWWGRLYSTDFILDVGTRQFLYEEMAHYGELVQPCR